MQRVNWKNRNFWEICELKRKNAFFRFIALSVLLKTQFSSDCSFLCVQSLMKILAHNAVFKDVYREVGLLEVFANLVQSFSDKVKQLADDTGGKKRKKRKIFKFEKWLFAF